MTLKQIQTLIYRGEIKSCNYRCGYCPFHKQDRNDKQQDEAALWRMVEHLPALGSPLNVLITPYGEALRYRYYMAATGGNQPLFPCASGGYSDQCLV